MEKYFNPKPNYNPILGYVFKGDVIKRESLNNESLDRIESRKTKRCL
jgi:hypothetical protein